MADGVRKESGGSVAVTLALYGAAGLAKIKGNHRWFLARAGGAGRLVFQEEGYAIPEFGSVSPDAAAQKAYWNYCRYTATCCLEAEAAIENPNAEALQAILLGQAVEQVCLGVLYVFWGFRPKCHGLGCLLDWCGLCLDGAPSVFPQNTREERLLLGVLGARMEGLRYRQDPPSITDIEILRARAHRLLEGAVTWHMDRRSTGGDTAVKYLPPGPDEDFILDTLSVTPGWFSGWAQCA